MSSSYWGSVWLFFHPKGKYRSPKQTRCDMSSQTCVVHLHGSGIIFLFFLTNDVIPCLPGWPLQSCCETPSSAASPASTRPSWNLWASSLPRCAVHIWNCQKTSATSAKVGSSSQTQIHTQTLVLRLTRQSVIRPLTSSTKHIKTQSLRGEPLSWWCC